MIIFALNFNVYVLWYTCFIFFSIISTSSSTL